MTNSQTDIVTDYVVCMYVEVLFYFGAIEAFGAFLNIKVIQGFFNSFKCVSRVCRVSKGCFKSVERVFHGCFNSVSLMIQDCFRSVSRVLQEKVSNDVKDILEKVFDDGDDIFEKVSDDAKDTKAPLINKYIVIKGR